MSAMLKVAVVLTVMLAAAPAAAQKVDPAARAAIVKAQQAQAAKLSYRVVNQTTRGDNAETVKAELIYVAPDRYHSKDLDGVVRAQVIRIGDSGWMKFGNEAWQAELFASSRTMRWFRGPIAIDDKEYKLLEARRLGSDQQPGGKASAYEYVVAKDDETLRVKMWVLDATGLPIRFDGDHRMGKDKDLVRWDVVYDEPLKVEPPVK